MDVLMVVIKFPPVFAGAAIQATYLAAALAKRGVRVQFLTDNDERPSAHETYQGLPVFRFWTLTRRETKLKEAIYVLQLFWFILTHPQYRVIHFHSLRGIETVLFPLLKLMGRKILVKLTLVGIDDPMTLSRRKLGRVFRPCLSFVDRFAAISTRLRELAVEAGIPAERIVLIPNGVNVERFAKPEQKEKKLLKERLGLARYEHVFLSIGKVESRKGYDLLLRAWQHIQSQVTHPALVIAGPGNVADNPYYRQLLDLIATLRLRDVKFVGEVSDVEAYMKSANGFLFCSEREGFGTVLIEAMATGVPVVARHIEGVTEEIVKEPQLGRICRETTPEAFAQCVVEFMRSKDLEQMDQAANRIRQEFDIQRIAECYVALYEELLGYHRLVPKDDVLSHAEA